MNDVDVDGVGSVPRRVRGGNVRAEAGVMGVIRLTPVPPQLPTYSPPMSLLYASLNILRPVLPECLFLIRNPSEG